MNPCLLCCRSLGYLIDKRTLRHIVKILCIVGYIYNRSTDVASLTVGELISRLTVYQLLQDRNRCIDRNRISHAFWGLACFLCHINPDDFSIRIEQRTAAVAKIDRCIGHDDRLGKIVNRNLTVQRTDNTARHALSIAKCISDRNRCLADLQCVRIANLCDPQLAPHGLRNIRELYSDNGQLIVLIHTLDLRRSDQIIGIIRLCTEADIQIACICHNMAVRRNQQLVIILSNDDSGSCALCLILLCPVVISLNILYRLSGNSNDGRHTVFYNCGDICRHDSVWYRLCALNRRICFFCLCFRLNLCLCLIIGLGFRSQLCLGFRLFLTARLFIISDI